MKSKYYSLIFVLTMFLVNVRAQQINIKAGLNLYDMLFELPTSTSSGFPPDFKLNSSVIAGFHGGFSSEYFFNKQFSAEMGLLYMQKGYSGKGTYQFTDPFLPSPAEFKLTYDIMLHYLDIPIQIKYRFAANDLRYYVSLGYNMGIGLDGKIRGRSEFMGNIDEGESPVKWEKDGFKRIESGLCGGAGIEYKNFLLGINYSHGITNLSATEEGTLKNRVVSVSVGYIINKQ